MKGRVFLFALFYKSRRPSLYKQERDTFIDQVITKIWAFPWKVFGLGDPSDWKPIVTMILWYHYTFQKIVLSNTFTPLETNSQRGWNRPGITIHHSHKHGLGNTTNLWFQIGILQIHRGLWTKRKNNRDLPQTTVGSDDKCIRIHSLVHNNLRHGSTGVLHHNSLANSHSN